MIYNLLVPVILLVILLSFHHFKKDKFIFLIIYVILIWALRVSLLFLDHSTSFAHLHAVFDYHILPFTCLGGPALWIYIKSLVNENFIASKKESLHIIPSFVISVLLIPYFENSFDFKIAFVNEPIESIHYYNSNENLSYIIPINFMPLTAFTINLGYIIFCLRTLHNSINRNSKLIVNRVHYFFKILKLFLFFGYAPMIILLVFSLIHRYNNDSAFFTRFNPNYFYLLTFISPSIVFFFPKWLYAIPEVDKIQNLITHSFEKKKRSITLVDSNENDQKVSDNYVKILAYLENEEPYLNPKFSIHHIAKTLDIPHVQITESFKKEFKVSFPKYRNKKRITHALELIHKGEHLKHSIEGIALLSGFKNKTTFYAAFKDVKNMTPTQWILKKTANAGEV